MSAIRAGLASEGYDRDYTNYVLFQRIGAYFRRYGSRLSLVTVLVTLLALFGAAVPVLVSRGVGLLEEGGDSSSLVGLLLIVSVLLIGVLTWAVNLWRRVQTTMLLGDVVLDMRRDAFRAAMNHDMGFFDEYQSGRIVSRITSDTDEFGRVAVLITELFTQLVLVLILVIYLLQINVRLTGMLVLVAPLALIVAGALQNAARRITRKSQQAIADVNVSIQEAVTGISVAKNFRQERAIYDEFLDVNTRSYDVNVRKGLILSMLFPSLQLVNALGIAILLYFGGRSTANAVITAGAWFLFMTSVDRFWFPMINLAAFFPQFQSALSATERIFALMDAEPAVIQQGAQPVPMLRGEIEFINVDFRYSAQEQVLQDFNLHIHAGESIALVGHTGAGKSSIAKLVTRFYEFQDGHLCIDGRDIRTLDLQAYRRHLGIVSQTPFLFAGTVADNIRYATPAMRDDEIAEVAHRIGRGDWVATLPEGLQTDVGERGSRLSMGQRQLVVLTRMLAQDPAIFILDEATASIDPFTEAQIQQALDMILRQRTSIVIAHRLSTVKAADRILVLEQGRIIEQGNHDGLMAQGGHYAALYDTYFRHQSLDFILSRGRLALEPLE